MWPKGSILILLVLCGCRCPHDEKWIKNDRDGAVAWERRRTARILDASAGSKSTTRQQQQMIAHIRNELQRVKE